MRARSAFFASAFRAAKSSVSKRATLCLKAAPSTVSPSNSPKLANPNPQPRFQNRGSRIQNRESRIEFMGAQWKQKWRELHADQKGKLVGKLTREIQVATKLGGPNPEFNARLAAAITNAKKQSVTRDTIERAIAKGSGTGADAVQYHTVVYEGFAPHQVPVIVECLTDNNNRTSTEIKMLFKAGTLGTPGSV